VLPVVLREPALLAWAIHIFLIPLYVFRSGVPQPGDLFIFILVPVALYRWNGKLPKPSREALRPLLWFTLWVCTVNYTWALITANFAPVGPDSYLLYPIYYIYNVLAFLVALVLYRRFGDVFLRLTVYAIMATVYIQVAVSFVMRSAVARGTLFFNNPNQLGYYALLAATLIALTHRRLRFRLISSGIALTCCGYLAMISASRAAAGGIAILLILLVFSNPKIILMSCLATAGLVAIGGPVTEAIEASQERVLNHPDNHRTFFEERGYDRIWAHKEYLVLGAGEGGLSRFYDGPHILVEIHSSAGTIIFSYGAVGAILFITFCVRVVRGSRRREMLMLVPPLLYTIAHQGLRFTVLWVLFAVFIAIKDEPSTRPASPYGGRSERDLLLDRLRVARRT
jgi:hypothetical protein